MTIKPTLSIVVPGIRTEHWQRLYETAPLGCGEYNFEMIFVGPYSPPLYFDEVKNVKYVRDWGNPSRALQIGAVFAESKYVTWAVDDGYFLPNGMRDAINLLKNSEKMTIANMVYTEGNDWKYNADLRLTDPNRWFSRHHHDDLRSLEGVPPDALFTVLFVMTLENFRTLGGIDCRFEGINLNLHDMSWRAEKLGFKIEHSMTPFQRIEWQQGGEQREREPIFRAYFDNDRPLVYSIWGTPETASKRRAMIPMSNWRDVEPIWSRKWGQNLIEKS